MNWLAWIVLGGLAGWVASMLTSNNARMGVITNIIVGIIGALVGSWALGQMGIINNTNNTFSIESFLIAVAGAVVLLFVYNLIRGKDRVNVNRNDTILRP